MNTQSSKNFAMSQKFSKETPPTEILQALNQHDSEKLKGLLQITKLDNSVMNYLLIEVIMSYSAFRDKTLIDLLLSKGASPHLEDTDGRTILMIAAERGLNEVMKTLMKFKPEINAQDKFGRNALLYAIDNNFENAEGVQVLIEFGASVNGEAADKSTPLAVAIQRDHLQIAQLLIRSRASVHWTNTNGDTALHIAVQNRSHKAIELLIASGADPNKKNKINQSAYDLCKDDSMVDFIVNLQKKYKQGEEPAVYSEEQTRKKDSNDFSQQGGEEMSKTDDGYQNKYGGRGAYYQDNQGFQKPQRGNQNQINQSKPQKGIGNQNAPRDPNRGAPSLMNQDISGFLVNGGQNNGNSTVGLGYTNQSQGYPSQPQGYNAFPMQYPQSGGQVSHTMGGQPNLYQIPMAFPPQKTRKKEDKYEIDLRDQHHTQNLQRTVNNESCIYGSRLSIQKLIELSSTEADLKGKINVISEEGTKCKTQQKELTEKIKDSQVEIERLEKYIAELENQKVEEEVITSKAISIESVISTSSTLKYLKSKDNDARLDEWNPKPDQPMDKLHKEIIEFEQSIDKQNKDLKPLIDDLLSKFEAAIARILPNAEVIILGSYATGLNLPSSTLDVIIKFRDQTNPNNASMLYNISDYLNEKEKDWVAESFVLDLKIGSVLKLTASKIFLLKKMDVSLFNEKKNNGLVCRELIMDYLDYYPGLLKPLYFVVKSFLMKFNLTDKKQAGLNSYGLLLMLVEFFQRSGSKDFNNLGVVLISFFYNYGFEHIMHIVPGKPLKSPDQFGNTMYIPIENAELQSWYHGVPLFIVQDPINKGNNVTRNTNIQRVRNACAAACIIGQQSCTCDLHQGYLDLKKAVLNDSKMASSSCTSVLQRIFALSIPSPSK